MPKVTGKESATKRIRDLSGQEQIERVGQALYAGGQAIKAEASFLITQGAVSGKNHVPSKPGEPPNEDTGFLRININVTQRAPLRVRISADAPYSGFLEFGTSRMEARPFMRPALAKVKDEIIANVRRAAGVK